MHRMTLRCILAATAISTALTVTGAVPAARPGDRYTVTPLVSDIAGTTPTTDPNLVNAWGLSRSATSPWWVADNEPGKATLYNSTGAITPLVVTVDGHPTGTVFSGIANNFLVGTATDSTLAPASFIFDGEDGNIRAWRGGSSALVTAHGGADAVYKGLAIAEPTPGQPLLYASDFHNARVDIFNGAWQLVTPPGAFVDPKLGKGYAPFGIQTIGSRVFVTYAKQDADAEDEVAGEGRGFVDAYDLRGNFLARVAQHGELNAPWGLALAPSTFGKFAGDLLVGNFGNGKINAFEERDNGHFDRRGELRDAGGKNVAIDGLWALEFGNAGSNGSPGTLFFTAGPGDESHGLFGTITPS